jgi:hypothetical protein
MHPQRTSQEPKIPFKNSKDKYWYVYGLPTDTTKTSKEALRRARFLLTSARSDTVLLELLLIIIPLLLFPIIIIE